MALITPAFTDDQTYPFTTLRLHMASLVSPGVVHPGDMLVSPGSGLQVVIAAGMAYVAQSVSSEGAAYKGLYFTMNDAPASPYNNISAPISNPRIDLVILRIYDVVQQTLSGSSYARFEWVQGTETSGATLANLAGAPSLPSNSLALAYALQTVGESSIPSANIKNVAAPVVQQNGGWQPLTLSSGFAPASPGTYDFYTPSARLIGDMVQLKGVIAGSGSNPIATIPAALRPSGNASGVLYYFNGSSSLAGNWNLFGAPGVGGTPGAFYVIGATFGAGSMIYLDGISYSMS